MQHYYYGKWENVNLIQLAKSQEKSNINVLQFLLIVTKEIVSIRYPFFCKTFLYVSKRKIHSDIFNYRYSPSFDHCIEMVR